MEPKSNNPILGVLGAYYRNVGDVDALVDLGLEKPPEPGYAPPAAIGATVEIKPGARVRVAPKEPEIGTPPIVTTQPQQLVVDRAVGDYVGARDHNDRVVFFHRDDIVDKRPVNSFSKALTSVTSGTGSEAMTTLVDQMTKGKK